MMRRTLPALALLLLLAACVAPSGGKQVRPDRTLRPESEATRQCLADLGALRARFTQLPEQDFGNGCSIKGSVELIAAGIPVSNVKAVQCPLARALTQWVREDVQKAARQNLGSPVARIGSMGGFSCRRINGAASGKLSEHATANAVDIGSFVLENGRTVSVKTGWNSVSDAERAFLRAVRSSACRRFQTVLSPDYNAAHHDHFHFDMGRGPFCR